MIAENGKWKQKKGCTIETVPLQGCNDISNMKMSSKPSKYIKKVGARIKLSTKAACYTCHEAFCNSALSLATTPIAVLLPLTLAIKYLF